MEEVKNEQDFKAEIENRMQQEVKQQEDSQTTTRLSATVQDS